MFKLSANNTYVRYLIGLCALLVELAIILTALNILSTLLDMISVAYITLSGLAAILIIVRFILYTRAYVSAATKNGTLPEVTYAKSHKIQTILFFAIILAILVTAFIFRGWIRGEAIPGYARVVYKPKVERVFDNNYLSIQAALNTRGLPLPSLKNSKNSAECDTLTSDLSTLTFSGIHESVNCSKLLSSKEITLDSTFIDQWRQQSQSFERYLSSLGYQKDSDEYNQNIYLNNLLDLDTDDNEKVISYTKVLGNTSCTLQIYSHNYAYNAKPPFNSPTAIADYQCNNSLDTFGGYNYYN